MRAYQIIQITPETYTKCNNIWDMIQQPQAQRWLDEIVAGARIPYAFMIDNEFLGECHLVLKNNDPHYTIEGKRACLSRLIVKKTQRNKGIGTVLVDYVLEQARQRGFAEISVGVDKDNGIALRLYRTKGFNEILYEGKDEGGAFYILLKRIS